MAVFCQTAGSVLIHAKTNNNAENEKTIIPVNSFFLNQP
jgi:hypothetical protein